MADVATPSAAAIFDASAEKKRPTKPDQAAYEADLKKAEKEHADAQAKFMAAKAKLDVAQPNKSKDSPAAKKRQDLISQLQEIRQKQAGGKAGRNQIFDQIKKLDEQLKSRIAEQKAERARVNFKNVDELDREIQRLEKEVEGGMMKLVDERKALTEISNLKKLRKGFASFDEAQKGIDDTKAKIKSLKESLDDPEAKALSAKYDALQAELNTIKAEQDEAYKNISTLREEREKLYSLQQEKWVAIRKIKDEYFQGKKAYRDYEQEQWKKQQERRKAEQEKYIMEKKKERAEKMLAEARDPAYLDEIRRAESLLHYLDPTTVSAAAPLKAPSGLSAAAQRTVDDSAIKGMKVVRKDKEDEYFAGTGGKKGKKGRKTTDAPSGKFSCPPSVIEDCAALGVEPPMSHEDKAKVAEKVKEKLDFWKKDQKAQTEKNVAKAQKEIERLEAEEANASGSATPTTNGKQENGSIVETVTETITAAKDAVVAEAGKIADAASQIAADLQGASIEDKKE